VHGVWLWHIHGVWAVDWDGYLDGVWVWLGYLNWVWQSHALGDGLDWDVVLVYLGCTVRRVRFVSAEVGVSGSVTAGRDESVSVTRGQDVGVAVTVGRRAAETVAGIEQAPLALVLAVVHSLLGRLVVGGQTVRAQR